MTALLQSTTKISIQISEAEKALDFIESELTLASYAHESSGQADLDAAKRGAALDQIRLVLKVFEHKALRIAELEFEISKLKGG